MRALKRAVPWAAAGLVAASVLAAGYVVRAQAPPCTPKDPPIEASLKWVPPPTGPVITPGSPVVFQPETPIPIILQVANVGCTDLRVPRGTAAAPYWLHLAFRDLTRGGTITSGERSHLFPSWCFSRPGLLLNPAIPVLTSEILPPSFVREYTIDDARQFYAVSFPGRYSAAFSRDFTTGSETISDCDQFPGRTLIKLDTAVTFAAPSNSLEFANCCYDFVGFLAPLDAPLTTRVGRIIPIKYRLFFDGKSIENAIGLISVTRADPPGPPVQGDLGKGQVPINQARFDDGKQYYEFGLDTRVLSSGDWDVHVTLEDGTDHTQQITFR